MFLRKYTTRGILVNSRLNQKLKIKLMGVTSVRCSLINYTYVGSGAITTMVSMTTIATSSH
jgi:hypothetical protein